VEKGGGEGKWPSLQKRSREKIRGTNLKEKKFIFPGIDIKTVQGVTEHLLRRHYWQSSCPLASKRDCELRGRKDIET